MHNVRHALRYVWLLPQAGGALIGPHALGLIQDVEAVRHLAELGVVFLLFNIGLELSLERLRQMQKYVFGMGSAQVSTPGYSACCPPLPSADVVHAGPHFGGR